MTTPILTKNQQRKSLSAKKGPIKGLKNILAQPNENYWPVLKHDNGAALETILKRLLPVLKRSENKILWSKLRKMTKEERLTAKKAIQIESNTDYDEAAGKFIVFGINAVTRLLEKDNACGILIEATVDPSLLIKHIVTMAQNKNVPILLISFLKDVTLQTVGFASAAIALKKDVKHSSENYFWILFEEISKLSLNLSNEKTVVSLAPNEISIDQKVNDNQEKFNTVEESNIRQPNILSCDPYLYRSSTKTRCFEPQKSFKGKQNIEITTNDFIALGDDEIFNVKSYKSKRFFESTQQTISNSNLTSRIHYKSTKKLKSDSSIIGAKTNKNKVSYKALKVKRLKGNEFRTKATKPPKLKKK